jgi:hypothetical protein
LEGSTDILLANNSLFESNWAFTYFGKAVDIGPGHNVQVVNNLLLTNKSTDMRFLGCTEDRQGDAGPGQGRDLHRHWRWGSNWREFAADNPAELAKGGWIPPAGSGASPGSGLSKLLSAAKDVLQKEIPVLSREQGHPDFLRPAPDSPLATQGEGVTDPSLPVYVGAVPPKGMLTWDWSRTWQVPPPGKLLTVSRDRKDGGQFRSINKALVEAKPWSTIRVLDSSTYEENIILDDAERHEGIALESLKQAVITNSHPVKPSVSIDSVPAVRIRGFRFTSSGPKKAGIFLVVTGKARGVILEGLNLALQGAEMGFLLKNTTAGEKGTPLLVRNCTVVGGETGIQVFARELADPDKHRPYGNIRIEQNSCRGQEAFGIILKGPLAQLQIAGNQIRDCPRGGFQVEALTPESRQILLVNNTVFDCNVGFRAWTNRNPKELAASRVELVNNLFFTADGGDMVAFKLVDDATLTGRGDDTLAQSLRTGWSFLRNHRDRSGTATLGVFPLGPHDKEIKGPKFVTRTVDDPDCMRPAKGEAWARDGAGQFNGALPTYVGAVPPEGMPVWDWDRTWRSRRK